MFGDALCYKQGKHHQHTHIPIGYKVVADPVMITPQPFTKYHTFYGDNCIERLCESLSSLVEEIYDWNLKNGNHPAEIISQNLANFEKIRIVIVVKLHLMLQE